MENNTDKLKISKKEFEKRINERIEKGNSLVNLFVEKELVFSHECRNWDLFNIEFLEQSFYNSSSKYLRMYCNFGTSWTSTNFCKMDVQKRISNLNNILEMVALIPTASLDISTDTDKISVLPFWGTPNENTADVFVIMPFEEKYKNVFSKHITNVCDKMKLKSLRADDMAGSTKIMEDVWSLIFNSKIIIADCTGKNSNVFYELGIAHTIGKKVIIITQNTDDIPFDIKHIRYIKYDFTSKWNAGI